MVTKIMADTGHPSHDAESSPPLYFNPDPTLILQSPPPLHPAWLAYEQAAGLLSKTPITDPKARQAAYSQACKDRNAHLLSGRDEDLNHGVHIRDTFIEMGADMYGLAEREPYEQARRIPIRSYNPPSWPSGPPDANAASDEEKREPPNIVIYYHGGGLAVGDLDSEDLTCRRICKELGCTVYSCDYRLMPDYKAKEACDDALNAFNHIYNLRKGRRWVLVGSSSGGQLAAMVAGSYGRSRPLISREFRPPASFQTQYRPQKRAKSRIHGVLLRGPVTCNAAGDGSDIPPRFRPFHTSMRPEFHTSLLSGPPMDASTRTSDKLPLEDDDFSRMPRHWIQVCTNDVLYSDGVLYAEALKHAGVEVKLDVVEGYPHTFWLKAPELERAVKADSDMIEGLRWLFESPRIEEEVEEEVKEEDNGRSIGRNYVPHTDVEFEKLFQGNENKA